MPALDRCEPLDYQALSDQSYMGVTPTYAQMPQEGLSDISNTYAALKKTPAPEENPPTYSGTANMGSTDGSVSDSSAPAEQSMCDSPVAAGCCIYPCSCPCPPITLAIKGVGDCGAKCNLACCCEGLCKVVCGLLCCLR